MAEKLCELRKKGGGGGRYTETSLWTNPSPSANFAAQTVSLSDSISNYKYIGIKYKFVTTGTSSTMAVYPVDLLKQSVNGGGTDHLETFMGIQIADNSMYARQIYYASETSIGFSANTRLGNTQSYINSSIPLEILGLNELDHGTMYTSNADVQQFKSVSANAIPTFTTKGKAVAIYITRYVNSGTKAVVYTNVNPTTGAINNSEIYMSDTESMPWMIWSSVYFIVTDNQITTNKAFSMAAHKLSIMYTY